LLRGVSTGSSRAASGGPVPSMKSNACGALNRTTIVTPTDQVVKRSLQCDADYQAVSYRVIKRSSGHCIVKPTDQVVSYRVTKWSSGHCIVTPTDQVVSY